MEEDEADPYEEEEDDGIRWGEKDTSTSKPGRYKSVFLKGSTTFKGKDDEVCLYDNVYLKPPDNAPPYIGKVVELFEEDGEKVGRFRWFWRIRDIPKKVKEHRKPKDPKEVFLAFGQANGGEDTNALYTVMQKVLVVCTASNVKNPMPSPEIIKAAKHVYHRGWNAEMQEIMPDLHEIVKELGAEAVYNKWTMVAPKMQKKRLAKSKGEADAEEEEQKLEDVRTEDADLAAEASNKGGETRKDVKATVEVEDLNTTDKEVPLSEKRRRLVKVRSESADQKVPSKQESQSIEMQPTMVPELSKAGGSKDETVRATSATVPEVGVKQGKSSVPVRPKERTSALSDSRTVSMGPPDRPATGQPVPESKLGKLAASTETESNKSFKKQKLEKEDSTKQVSVTKDNQPVDQPELLTKGGTTEVQKDTEKQEKAELGDVIRAKDSATPVPDLSDDQLAKEVHKVLEEDTLPHPSTKKVREHLEQKLGISLMSRKVVIREACASWGGGLQKDGVELPLPGANAIPSGSPQVLASPKDRATDAGPSSLGKQPEPAKPDTEQNKAAGQSLHKVIVPETGAGQGGAGVAARAGKRAEESKRADDLKRADSAARLAEDQKGKERTVLTPTALNVKQLPSFHFKKVKPVGRVVETWLARRQVVVLDNLNPAWKKQQLLAGLNNLFDKVLDVGFIKLKTSVAKSAWVAFADMAAAEQASGQLRKKCLVLGDEKRPAIARIPEPPAAVRHKSFPGHIKIAALPRRTDGVEAVATSHCSQPNTIEFELALQWRLLHVQQARQRQLLQQKQAAELQTLLERYRGKKQADTGQALD